ncbi:MAG: ABC transporter substrate-binding protein, partial [Bacillota bacterium]|nr:ABC transporter substrate-binding protein [Bacillota bacterium]
VEWVKDERIVLKANEKYWRGAPSVKKVIFKPIPEAASRVMALQSGEVDIIVNVPPHQVATIEKSTKASVAKVASIRIIFLPFVSRPGSPVNNPLVRQALNYAVDVQGIISSLLAGNAVELTQTLANTEFGFDPNLKAYSYDLAKAKELLAAAGYPNGFKLTFLAPTGRYMMDKEVAEAVKSQLTALGLEVDLKIQEWGVYVEKLLARTVEADIFMIGWSSGIFDADGTLFSWFRSGQRFGYYQFDAARIAQMDNILDEARTILDTKRREELYRQALKMTHDDAAWVPLYQQSDIYGVSNRIQWTPRSDEFIQIYNAKWK